jgi:hypothetical protein
LFPVGADRQLAEELTSALLLRAEGVTKPSAAHLANTAAYIHTVGLEGSYIPPVLALLVPCVSKS